MAVKGQQLKFSDAPSIDQRWKEQKGGAEKIQNFRIDPQGDGWLADRGLEPWIDHTGAQIEQTLLQDGIFDKQIDSQFIWTKQSTGQVYHIIEQGGELYYLWGNNGTAGASNYFKDKVTIATNRRARKVGDVGTQFIPYGNRLLITNGYDKPIWFYGETRFRDFGFNIVSPSPEVIDVNITYGAVTDLTDGIPRPTFNAQRTIGLGDTGENDKNVFAYRMSFVTDTGSESPLGLPSFVSWNNDATYKAKRGVFLIDIPTGKKGIVARRIYRTKNMRSQAGNDQDQLYYLVRQLEDNSTDAMIDVIPDSSLVTLAPELTESEAISSTFLFGAAWNNRLFLGGGPDHPTRIIYSKTGLPEQFPTFNYFDIGTSVGGHITKLMPYYNSLLVFRERSIDIIREGAGGLTIATLTPDVGTTASNTICLVPGVGVVFLNKDGLYTTTGGLEGGSQVQVVKISDAISRSLETANIAALPNACAAYSKKEKEYWLHFVRKGEVVPTRGIVLHSYNGSFSQRGANNKADEYKWAFTTIQADPDGNFILGTKPDWRLPDGSPANSLTATAIGSLVGLQVWSGAKYWGKSLTSSGPSGQPATITYTGAEAPLQPNVWESNWFNFGSAGHKHRVFNVEMEMVSYGDNLVELDWGYDYDPTWYSAGGQKISKPELVFTSKEDPVFGPIDATITKSTFRIAQDSLRGGRIVVIRWDVNTQLADNFRFRVKQTSGKPFHILGFNVNYNSTDQLPLNQRTRIQKGQPY
jgi:hypothetical protein